MPGPLSFLEWPWFLGVPSPYPTHKPAAPPAAPLLEVAFPYTKQLLEYLLNRAQDLALEPLSFLKAKSVMTFSNKGCVTLWPCHLH